MLEHVHELEQTGLCAVPWPLAQNEPHNKPFLWVYGFLGYVLSLPVVGAITATLELNNPFMLIKGDDSFTLETFFKAANP